MRYPPLWGQHNQFPAALDRSLLGTLWPAGGLVGGAATAVAGSMVVDLAPGTVVVPLQAGQGSALCRWDAVEALPALDPGSAQGRRDLIVAQVRDPDLDGGGASDFVFQVRKGTPAASAPALPAAGVNALGLYEIPVPAGAANLNGAIVTAKANSNRSRRNPGAAPALWCGKTAGPALLAGPTHSGFARQDRVDLRGTINGGTVNTGPAFIFACRLWRFTATNPALRV